MKTKFLLSGIALSATLLVKAQFHPAGLWANSFTYDAAPHNHESWSASGYTLYNIAYVKDANGYATSITTSTPPPLTQDQYKSTGSHSGNVYTATTQKNHNGGAFEDWRRDTWQGDGTNDTTLWWEDYSSGSNIWTNVEKHVFTYASNGLDYETGYQWTSGAWVLYEKTVMTYATGKRDRFTGYSWNTTSSAWDEKNYYQYFYTGNKLDSIQQWNKDATSGNFILKSRIAITCNANGKTTMANQFSWDNNTNQWKPSLSMAFTDSSGTTTGIEDIYLSNPIAVYPVPANDHIVLNTSNLSYKNSTVHMMSITGSLVGVYKMPEEKLTINTGDYSNGAYFLIVENNGKIIYRQKVMIAH